MGISGIVLGLGVGDGGVLCVAGRFAQVGMMTGKKWSTDFGTVARGYEPVLLGPVRVAKVIDGAVRRLPGAPGQ